MNPGGKLKPGQRWSVIRDHKYHDQQFGDNFTVIRVCGTTAEVKWDIQPELQTVMNEPDTWKRNYRLDESFSVTEILSKYES